MKTLEHTFFNNFLRNKQTFKTFTKWKTKNSFTANTVHRQIKYNQSNFT